MAKLGKELVIVGAKRTAFGALSGSLKGINANDLAVHAAKAAIAQSGIAVTDIGHVVVGNVAQTSADAIYCARHVGLRAGIPHEVPAITLNRLCGSGFQAVITGAEQILTGQANAVLVGGTENMSMAPHVVHGMREGARFGRPPAMKDLLWECLTDTQTGLPMAQTAEKLGDQYKLTRAEVDQVALDSQNRWHAAQAAGRFNDEIVPFMLKTRKGEVAFSRDEHPRETTPETLAKLAPVFRKDGFVTAGDRKSVV